MFTNDDRVFMPSKIKGRRKERRKVEDTVCSCQNKGEKEREKESS
jgi:hypothetical protein